MWTMWHIRFTYENNLQCVFANVPESKTLAANWLETGLHYVLQPGVQSKVDHLPLDHWVPELVKFPQQPLVLGWNGDPVSKEEWATTQAPAVNAVAGVETGLSELDSGIINTVNQIIPIANRIKSEGNIIGICVINDAFVPFTYHWLCNTRYMNVHSRVVFVATDAEAYRKMKENEFGVTTLYMPYPAGLEGNLNYGQTGYYRSILYRSEFFLALLKNKVDFWNFETDAVWFKNAFDIPEAQAPDADIIAYLDDPDNKGISFGINLFRASKPCVKIFGEMVRQFKVQMDRQASKNNADPAIEIGEQKILNNLLLIQYAPVKIHHVPLTIFVSGQWYPNFRNDGLELRKKAGTSPAVINFNWVIGNANKISRAKKYGHWILNNDNTCNNDALVNLPVTLVKNSREVPTPPPK